MDITSLEKSKMVVMKEMADVSVLVSESKAELFKLQADKERFFTERDKETSERVDKLLKDSEDILSKVIGNYKQAHEFYEVLEGFSSFLSHSHNEFNDNVKDFTKKRVLWQKFINDKESELEELRKDLLAEKESMDRERLYFKTKTIQMEKERKHIESQNKSLETAYTELKQLWNKIH